MCLCHFIEQNRSWKRCSIWSIIQTDSFEPQAISTPYIHAFIRGTHVCYSLKAHALERESSLEKLKEPLFVMFPSLQLQWGMRSGSVTRPHYERQETALITERKWPKQWTKPRINRICRNYFIRFLFGDKTKAFTHVPIQRNGKKNNERLGNWRPFILNTGFNTWESFFFAASFYLLMPWGSMMVVASPFDSPQSPYGSLNWPPLLLGTWERKRREKCELLHWKWFISSSRPFITIKRWTHAYHNLHKNVCADRFNQRGLTRWDRFHWRHAGLRSESFEK